MPISSRSLAGELNRSIKLNDIAIILNAILGMLSLPTPSSLLDGFMDIPLLVFINISDSILSIICTPFLNNIKSWFINVKLIIYVFVALYAPSRLHSTSKQLNNTAAPVVDKKLNPPYKKRNSRHNRIAEMRPE